MNLLDRYRRVVDDTDVTGTPFHEDNRNFLARALMPAPAPARMPVAPPGAEDRNVLLGRHTPTLVANEAWARADGSPWKRPELLTRALDLYADATSTPKGAATDFVLGNFLGPAAARIPKPVMAGARIVDAPPGLRPDSPRYSWLPMDDASRNQRAKALGFDADTTWYHGSPEANLKTITPGYDEPGAWFTTDRSNAASYARGSNPGMYYTRLRTSNPFVVRNMGDGDFMPSHDGKKLDFLDNVEIVKHAQRSGYDSVHFPDGNFSESGNTMVVFSPQQIRDVDARFDPKHKNSPNLLASYAGTAAAGLGALLAGAGSDGTAVAGSGRVPGGGAPRGGIRDFDDSLIEILRKYGLAGLMAGAGAAGATSDPEPTQ